MRSAVLVLLVFTITSLRCVCVCVYVFSSLAGSVCVSGVANEWWDYNEAEWWGRDEEERRSRKHNAAIIRKEEEERQHILLLEKTISYLSSQNIHYLTQSRKEARRRSIRSSVGSTGSPSSSYLRG